MTDEHAQVSRDKAIRCMTVILANNKEGIFIAVNLISNMFDLDKDTAHELLENAWKAKELHKSLGGSLRDFENGLILTEKTDKDAELDKMNEAAEEVLASVDETLRCTECGSTNYTGADHNKCCNDCGNFFVNMKELGLGELK